jgi:hypothetical protein
MRVGIAALPGIRAGPAPPIAAFAAAAASAGLTRLAGASGAGTDFSALAVSAGSDAVRGASAGFWRAGLAAGLMFALRVVRVSSFFPDSASFVLGAALTIFVSPPALLWMRAFFKATVSVSEMLELTLAALIPIACAFASTSLL